jgi:tyrosine-protein kinase Etk/Wzc
VVDCPPLLAVADPRLIGTAVDAMLLVLASGSTKLSEAERSAELLRDAGAHIAGFILNKAPERAGSYYGYQYAGAYTDPD